jgi:hypothetical protein
MSAKGRRRLRALNGALACQPRTPRQRAAERADSLALRERRRAAKALAAEAVRARVEDRARVDRVRVANVGRKRMGLPLLDEATDDPR